MEDPKTQQNQTRTTNKLAHKDKRSPLLNDEKEGILNRVIAADKRQGAVVNIRSIMHAARTFIVIIGVSVHTENAQPEVRDAFTKQTRKLFVN